MMARSGQPGFLDQLRRLLVVAERLGRERGGRDRC